MASATRKNDTMSERHTDSELVLIGFGEPGFDGFRRATEQETQASLIRRRVMSYMSHKGEHRSRLTDSQWAKCWLLGDGFGHADREFAREQCWDWSHVRDSSERALAMMWEAIKRFDPKRPGA